MVLLSHSTGRGGCPCRQLVPRRTQLQQTLHVPSSSFCTLTHPGAVCSYAERRNPDAYTVLLPDHVIRCDSEPVLINLTD